jgi:hypothetical protein
MFVKSEQTGVDCWTGFPDCQAAHVYLLLELKSLGVPLLAAGTALTSRRKGNLGEFIALTIGRRNDFRAPIRFIAANALDPLSDISRPHIDILCSFLEILPIRISELCRK